MLARSNYEVTLYSINNAGCKLNQSVIKGSCGCNPQYYLNASGYCISCDSACFECNGPYYNNCTSCKVNQNLIKNTCQCVSNFFMNTSGFCVPCIQNCGYCVDNQNCLRCKSGHYLEGNSSCLPCFGTCKECTNGTDKDCLSCSNTSIVISKTPSSCSCASGQYIQSSNPLTCSNCSSHCLNCTSSGCSLCDVGYQVIKGTCDIKILSLSTAVTLENNILLQFDESLLKNLTTSDLTLMYENQYISININITDTANYIIIPNTLAITATSNTTYLNFITTILGQSYSILKQTDYTIILNSPKNTGPSAVAAAVSTVNQVLMSVVASSAASSLLTGNQPSLV